MIMFWLTHVVMIHLHINEPKISKSVMYIQYAITLTKHFRYTPIAVTYIARGTMIKLNKKGL